MILLRMEIVSCTDYLSIGIYMQNKGISPPCCLPLDQMNPRKKRKFGGAVPGSDPDNPVIIG